MIGSRRAGPAISSLKRNLGLLLARLHGWNKIAFIDDDIKIGQPEHFARLAGQLEFYQAAGMVVDEYPDNSVVCHARRLAGSAARRVRQWCCAWRPHEQPPIIFLSRHLQ